LFLIDCDYDVLLKLVSPSPNLVITEHADLEADLLAAGGWERLVSDLVPAALEDDDRLNEIVYAVVSRTVALADVLGRYRIVARKLAFRAETAVRHRRYRVPGSSEIDESRMIRSLWQSSAECPISEDTLRQQMGAIGPDYNNCNGHDLVSALNHVLREDFGVREQSADHLSTQLRLGVVWPVFESLAITQRVRGWETLNGLSILRS
jgi:hypothetical protein